MTRTNPDQTVEFLYFTPQDEYLKGRTYQVNLKNPSQSAILRKDVFTWSKVPSNAATFVRLDRETTFIYNNDQTRARKQQDYTYDKSNGNILSVQASGTGAESVTTYSNWLNYGTSSHWIWRKQSEWIVGAQSGQVRKTTWNFETSTGNRLWEQSWLSGGVLAGADPVTHWTYDGYGNIETVEDPNGNLTSYVYDPQTYTYPIQITYPQTGAITHISSYEWNYRYGKLASFTDENNLTTNYDYDLFGRRNLIGYPDGGHEVTTHYDDSTPRYMTTNICESDGSYIQRVDFFDNLGRVIQAANMGIQNKTQKKIVTQTSYDIMGRVHRVNGPFYTSAAGFVPGPPPSPYAYVIYDYDYHGRVTTETRPHGEYGTTVTCYEYYDFDTKIIDPDSKARTERRDYLGRIYQVVEFGDTANYTTDYRYNAARDLLEVENSEGHQVTKTYDTLGREATMDDPGLGHWEYAYDANGNLIATKDARGVYLHYTYDELDRKLAKSVSASWTDPGTTVATYAYDNPACPQGKGKLHRVSTTGVTRSYIWYNRRGLATRVALSLAGQGDYLTQYEYDLSNKLTSIVYPDNNYEVTYTYYPGTGLLEKVSGSDGRTFVEFDDYEPTGKIGYMYLGNGTATSYSYDPESTRLTKIRVQDPTLQLASDIYRRVYRYTRAGDIKKIDDELQGFAFNYTYDNLHRLLSETNTGAYQPLEYTYSPAGNILTQSIGSDVMTYAYNPARPHAVASVTKNGVVYDYTYDENGNMLTGPDLTDTSILRTRTITYDRDNMPIRVDYQRGGLAITTNFAYDGDMKRIKKSVQGGGATYYVNEYYEIINNEPVRYIMANDLRIVKITPSATWYFHKDHLGSTVAITREADGGEEETSEYMPYGHERDHTGTRVSDYKFTDQELDLTTGLYNYDARLYDPMIGRFVSPDSILPNVYDPQQLNRYTYCRNNPLIYTDPTGNTWIGMGKKAHEEVQISNDRRDKEGSVLSTPDPEQAMTSLQSERYGQTLGAAEILCKKLKLA